jgi:hypothetical protein
MPGEDRKGAVDLLGEYDAGKLMGQRQTAEGKKKVGSLARCSGPSIGGTDSEHETLNSLVTQATDLSGELLRGVLLASAVKQDCISRHAPRLPIQPIEDCHFGVEEQGLAWNVSGGTFDIVGKQTIRDLRFGTSTTRDNAGKNNFHCTFSNFKSQHRRIDSPESSTKISPAVSHESIFYIAIVRLFADANALNHPAFPTSTSANSDNRWDLWTDNRYQYPPFFRE